MNAPWEPKEMKSEYEPEPWLYRLPNVSHYYGDNVRQLLMGAAALMLLAAPFYTSDLFIELPFIIIATVVIVCIAALTNPKNQTVIIGDTVICGVGLVIFEAWALFSYESVPLYVFALREGIAIIFFFALYFSTKTLRAMMLHQVGKHDTPLDFETREGYQHEHPEHAEELEKARREQEVRKRSREERYIYDD